MGPGPVLITLFFMLNSAEHEISKLDKPNTRSLKIVPSKAPVHGHEPKFLFPRRHKTVPLVYDKNTSKWSSNSQI